jgi:hypothetical protein
MAKNYQMGTILLDLYYNDVYSLEKTMRIAENTETPELFSSYKT